eukprot:s16_g39.t1
MDQKGGSGDVQLDGRSRNIMGLEMPSYMSAALTWGTEKPEAEVVVCGLACMDIVQQLEKFPEADDKVCEFKPE